MKKFLFSNGLNAAFQPISNKNTCSYLLFFAKILFINILIFFCNTTIYAQVENEIPQGKWELVEVQIKQVMISGDTIVLPYISDYYNNSTDCIYPVLRIQADQCIFEDNDLEYPLKYSYKNGNIFVLWFTAPIEFEYTIQTENTLSLSRQYGNYNPNLKNVVSNDIRLVYIKK